MVLMSEFFLSLKLKMVFSLTGLFLVSGVLRAGLETIKDHSLKQALDREDVSSSGILMIEDHLKAFPGTFRIENNEYGADLSRLVKYRQRLLLSLRNHHKYKQAYKNGVSLKHYHCLLYTSPSPRDATLSRMPSSA